jgi:hypothetical protein
MKRLFSLLLLATGAVPGFAIIIDQFRSSKYETHVPIVFFGAGVKPGHYATSVAPNDIAPTVSDIIGVAVPAGSVGHAIREILQ